MEDLLLLLAKYASVFIAAMFKYFIGPISGYALGLSVWETFILSVSGMMTSVITFSILGNGFKKKVMNRYFSKKRLFTKWNRTVVKIWIRFGNWGIAFITPLLLTPVGGAIVATSFGQHWKQFFFHMLVSAVVWGLGLVLVIYGLGYLGYEQFIKH